MKRLLTVLRGILCVIVISSVLEICARVDDVLRYGAPFWGAYNNESLYAIDKIGKWGKPRARYEQWELNSLGYRGPELRPGTMRIVCFGASETFGLYEAPDEEYPRQLERDLNKLAGGPFFQVVNVAYPGESLPTAILRVPEVVSQVHPSYALIYPALAEYISIVPTSDHPVPSKTSLTRTDWLLELRVAHRVRNLLKSALPRAVRTKLLQLQIKRDSAHMQVMERLPEGNVERFREDLTGLIGALRDHQVDPVLVTHASAVDSTLSPTNQDLLTGWRKFYPMLNEDGFIDMEQRMNQVIRQTAIREKLILIDAANEVPPRPEYFADFVHFTTAGAEVMAADLAAGLKPVVLSQSKGDASIPSADQSPASKGVDSSRHPAASNR